MACQAMSNLQLEGAPELCLGTARGYELQPAPAPCVLPQPPFLKEWGMLAGSCLCASPLAPVDTNRALGKAKQVQFLLQNLQSLPPLLALVMAERGGVLPALLQLRASPCCW